MMLEKSDFIYTFDLKSGYHYVHEESQQCLEFAWECSYCFYSVTFWFVHCLFCFHQAKRTLKALVWVGYLDIDESLTMSSGL